MTGCLAFRGLQGFFPHTLCFPVLTCLKVACVALGKARATPVGAGLKIMGSPFISLLGRDSGWKRSGIRRLAKALSTGSRARGPTNRNLRTLDIPRLVLGLGMRGTECKEGRGEAEHKEVHHKQ